MPSKSPVSLDVRAAVPVAVRRLLVKRLARAVGLAEPGGELTISLTDDAEIQALNRDYAGEDHATDVLSFSMREGEGGELHPQLLGDVVISVETAARQAAAGGRSLDEELFHLAVHGLAHLLGYDHATKAEERVMFGFEAELRAQALGAGRVVTVPRPAWPPRR